jgi:hypothetical protein
MTIIQDLYNIYDKESAKYRARRSSQGSLLRELQRNLAFLREGLGERLPQAAIVAGLEDGQFRAAADQGVRLDALQKKPLGRDTYAGIREFERYRGWETARLIDSVYERIAILKKLSAGSQEIDLHARLTTLFKFLMVVVAHVEGRRLPLPERP